MADPLPPLPLSLDSYDYSPSATSQPIQISSNNWNNNSNDDDPNTNNPAPFAYTPSYQGSYGSDLSWGGREHQIYPDDDYNPSDYDAPSPFMFMADHLLSPNHPDHHFAPQQATASPASSASGHSRASSVSSINNNNNNRINGTSPHIGADFDKLAFDPVEQDVQWRTQHNLTSPPPPASPTTKPRSPPQLVIPSQPDASTTGASLPSLPSLFPPGAPFPGHPQLGLPVPGPFINIVPSTPVSGGGGTVNDATFQRMMRNFTDAATTGGSAGSATTSAQQPHPRSTPAPSGLRFQTPIQSPPATSSMQVESSDWQQQQQPQQQSNSFANSFQFPQHTPPVTSSSSPFTMPATSPLDAIPRISGQQQTQPSSSDTSFNDQYLYGYNNNSRPRARSDTGVRPIWGGLVGPTLSQQSSGGAGTVNPNEILPSSSGSSFNQQSPYQIEIVPPSNANSSATGGAGAAFGHSLLPFHVPASDDGGVNLAFGDSYGQGTSTVRRAKSDSSRHGRGTRSEDLHLGNAASSSSGAGGGAGAGGPGFWLAPTDPRTPPPQGSPGPTRHRRAASGGDGRHSRNSSMGSSSRVSPYPSPSGSPATHHDPLPPSSSYLPHPSLSMAYPPPPGTNMNVLGGSPGLGGNTGLPAGNGAGIRVERQQVTTPATASASEKRRKQDATFQCPVPGCGSTFTRHFNLKGHMRSHNEERPFKCKWPGCEKGFARQHDCKRHEALHLNIRPYTCDGCQKTFARMDALNRHLRSEGGTECQRQSGDNSDASGGGGSHQPPMHSFGNPSDGHQQQQQHQTKMEEGTVAGWAGAGGGAGSLGGFIM